MKIIELSGEIGWEIWAGMVRQLLNEAKGDDITMRFSSVGGNIFEGADIFNMLSDYKRDNPKSKMVLEIKAVAASMGSLIAASPVWDEIAIEPTSMTMIHNPWNIAAGDYKAMEASAKFLKSSRDLYLDVYTSKSGKTTKEIASMMDDETWFMGQEIIDNGFADRMLDSEVKAPQNKGSMVASMKSSFSKMAERQKQVAEGTGFDSQRAAACLSHFPESKKESNTKPENGQVMEIKEPVQAGNNSTEVPKVETKAELEKELPKVYAEVRDDGVKAERERVAVLMALKKKDEYKNIPEVVAVIDNAINDGSTMDQVQPLMMAAMVKIMKDPARVDEIESPGEIQGGDMQIKEPVVRKQTRLEV